jgi:hypothetical protein
MQLDIFIKPLYHKQITNLYVYKGRIEREKKLWESFLAKGWFAGKVIYT